MNLLTALMEKQKAEGVSDRAFAKKLGVSHALWSNTKRGKYPIQFQILTGAVKAYPTLADTAVSYLIQFGNNTQQAA